MAGTSATGYPHETPQVHGQPRPSGQAVCLRALRLRLLGSGGTGPRTSVRAPTFLGPKVNGRCDIRAKALNSRTNR